VVHAEFGGRLLCLLELLAGLADVDGDADNVVVAVLLHQEGNADGGIEPAGEGERDGAGWVGCGVSWQVGCHVWCGCRV